MGGTQPGRAAPKADNVDGAKRRVSMGRSNMLKHTPGDVTLSMRPGTQKDDEDRDLITRSLCANPNIRRLAPFNQDQIRQLVDVAWKQVIEEGQDIMTEADLNNETFYIVADGTFQIIASLPFEVVFIDGMSFLSRPKDLEKVDEQVGPRGTQLVRQMHKGASFGDSSMLYQTPRWATARAECRSVVWVISQSDFKVVQLQTGRAAAAEKTADHEALLTESLEANTSLQRLMPLQPTHIKQLVQLFWVEPVAAGKVVMKEGDLNADTFYVVGEGKLEASADEPFDVEWAGRVSYLIRSGHGLEDSKRRSLKNRSPIDKGCCFGEISMVYCAPRLATLTAVEDSVLLAMDRSTFLSVQKKAAEDEQKMRLEHLQKLEVLSTFSQDDKEKLAGVMERMRFTRDEVLLGFDGKKNERHPALYILEEGSVSHTVNAEDPQKVSNPDIYEADPSSEKYHYFGEIATSSQSTQKEVVKVVSNTATFLVLERKELRKIWDRLLEGLPVGEFQRYATSATKVGNKNQGNKKSNLDDIGLFGNSALGPINLVQNRVSKEMYALKTQYKSIVVAKGLQKSVVRERKVWMEVLSPFIVRLFDTYNEPTSVGFLMEAAFGGELLAAYCRHNLYGQVDHAKYYTAGVVLALEHLHKRRIVYRNIKPQNILLTHDGYPKLTDFSFAKHIVGHTFTTCGTPTYMAPEMLTGAGHNRAVDWWALGILAYELMVGSTPFETTHPMEVYAKVVNGIAAVDMPEVCTGPVADLVTTLLSPQALDRLAMRQGGPENVIQHPWFEGFKWSLMRIQHLEPPYKPCSDTAVLPQGKDSERSAYLAFFSPTSISFAGAEEYQDDGTGLEDVFEQLHGDDGR